MLRPNPTIWRGRWVVDLRAAGFGNRYVLGAAGELDREAAIHAAYALLSRRRGEGIAEIGQRSLFDDAAPTYLAALIDRWQADKHYDRDGSKRYGATYTRIVRAELGEYKLADFAPPQGNARVQSYVTSLTRAGLSGRTIRNRLSILSQALRCALLRGWLLQLPVRPSLPPKAPAVFTWLSEPMFRALRAEVYRGVTLSSMARAGIKTAGELAEYVEKRRCYLSWLFYTGVHNFDADRATADWLFLDGAAYVRHNHKSSAVVAPEQFEMPIPLLDDLRALEKLLGRPLYPGESFTGGPWPDVSRVMQRAARALRFPHGANPRVLRKSFARQMCLLGYTERETADRMGHVDIKLIREVYAHTPRGAGHARSRWGKLPAQPAAVAGAGMAQVLQFVGPEGDGR